MQHLLASPGILQRSMPAGLLLGLNLALPCREARLGLPPVLQHFLTNCQALHAVCVLIQARHVPVSHVLPRERLVVQPLPGFPGYDLVSLCPCDWGCPAICLLMSQ